MTLTATFAADAAADKLRPVRLWLWSVAALVFLMVIVGGATRLTQSGLSITEWKLVTGVLPPLSDAAWLAEFEKYKIIPQFAQLFPDMDVSGFKFIYFWEWGHRLLGRVIGLAYGAPLAWFWFSARIPEGYKGRLLALLGLGALQGFVGWWMVTSGLSGRVDVSQYRLALHLLLASLTLAGLVHVAVSLKSAAPEHAPGRVRAAARIMLALVFAQIGLGALVAGLHAGRTYNTWPLMDGRLVPPLADLTRDTPWWSNFFENVTTVQFDHRLAAYGLLAVALWHAFDAARIAPGSKAVRRARALAGMVLAQGVIGILTLIYVVPLHAALAHQAFAMMILAMAAVHWTRVRARTANGE